MDKFSKSFTYDSIKQRRSDRELKSGLKELRKEYSSYFASTKSTFDYQDLLESSIDRYNDRSRDNLYAIVLPAGHGKSHYAKKYGFIDVDNLLGPRRHNELMELRVRLVNQKSVDWQDHNRVWYSMLNEALDLLDLSEPTMILCHTEELALEVGAQIMGAAILEEGVFKDNIKRRTFAGQQFSAISREVAMNRSVTPYVTALSNRQLESWLVNTCNGWSFPIAVPYAFSRRYENTQFAASTPTWITEGRLEDLDVDNLLLCYEDGLIPKSTVDYFARVGCKIGGFHGFGISIWDWSKWIGLVTDAIGKPQQISKDCDFAAVFPPRSGQELVNLNLTLRRLNDVFKFDDDPEVRTILEHHVGDSHVFVTGLVSHCKGVMMNAFERDSTFMYLYKIPEKDWDKVLKPFHDLVRRSVTYGGMELNEKQRQALMYMNILLGRKLYAADLQAVIEERNGYGVEVLHKSYVPELDEWSVQQYKEDFTIALNAGYHNIFKPKPLDVTSFLEFWRVRYKWVTKGSTVLNDLKGEDRKYVITFLDGMYNAIEKRHNKKSAFECHDLIEMIGDVSKKINLTRVVGKPNETGKERSLMPGTLAHYIAFCYVLYACEKKGQVGSVRVNAPKDDDLQYFEARMGSGLTHLMYDWANFNAQHSIWEMDQVIRMLQYQPNVPEDYAYFCCVIADSFSEMYVLGEDDEEIKLERGLYSGWRGTSWINGVLNYVYLHVAWLNYERLGGKGTPAYVDHGGDDVDMAFGKTESCIAFEEVMNLMGFDAQRGKQMIDKRAEFFRNTMSRGAMQGNPTRALANFVSGNWEKMTDCGLQEKVTGILDAIAQMKRRGVGSSFCEGASLAALAHWCKVRTDEKWVPINKCVLHGRVEDGALGIPDNHGMLWELETKINRNPIHDVPVRLPGIAASVELVKDLEIELKQHGLFIKNKERLVQVVARDSYDINPTMEYNEWAKFCQHESKVTAYHPSTVELEDEGVMMEYLSTEVPKEFEYIVSETNRLENFVAYITDDDGTAFTVKELIRVIHGLDVQPWITTIKFNEYYRRLVPDFLATSISKYIIYLGCTYGISEEEADMTFKILTSMSARHFKHCM